ncbi:DUF3369 domain-containing protein [Marinobacterium rhizophilum]|uniref:DUF3369 domain-containing protein n=1 Tax=Marinobacterium rhizophilum TaxID=420402 RepID=UPI00037B127E|nr:DUF3369 domain-containing protein [Marinobacterium rhizophilum]
MHSADDELLFSDETLQDAPTPVSAPAYWKILIVDDEQGIHTITEVALCNVKFAERGLAFLHAYSGEEAKCLMAEHDDIAVVLLDVVMETDDAGLHVADYIRQDLDNHRARIILRTGQPGRAPEEEVIKRYDINDYKEKTELTYRKLFSAVYTALRSYRDIVALERNRAGLEKVIDATATILERKSMETFAEGVLEQLAALLYLDAPVLVADYKGVVAEKREEGLSILASSSRQAPASSALLERKLQAQLMRALSRNEDVVDDDYCVRHIGADTILYLTGRQPVAPVDQHLIDLFCRNVSIAFDNLRLNDTLRHTQKEIVYSLCELAETRSKETGNHVRRVAHYSRLMAEELGLSPAECEQVFLASPLHDVGKIGIPDAILNKPGTLSSDEWAVMKTHTTIGAQIMKRSRQPIMQAGAIIAEQHHENWDGSGYPQGLAGTDIHFFGRIVALADVFDALASKRCYKDCWAMEAIDAFIHEQAGVKFDPALVEIYKSRRDGFIAILEQFRDGKEAKSTVAV